MNKIYYALLLGSISLTYQTVTAAALQLRSAEAKAVQAATAKRLKPSEIRRRAHKQQAACSICQRMCDHYRPNIIVKPCMSASMHPLCAHCALTGLENGTLCNPSGDLLCPICRKTYDNEQVKEFDKLIHGNSKQLCHKAYAAHRAFALQEQERKLHVETAAAQKASFEQRWQAVQNNVLGNYVRTRHWITSPNGLHRGEIIVVERDEGCNCSCSMLMAALASSFAAGVLLACKYGIEGH
jgi:hypothetical protein